MILNLKGKKIYSENLPPTLTAQPPSSTFYKRLMVWVSSLLFPVVFYA